MSSSENIVDIIREKILLSDFIGRKVLLVKKGNEYKGLCPFHNEKTPSFTVSDDKGFYHCFGCSAHGDIISFVMQQESIEFKDALKVLANEAGINLSDHGNYDKKFSKETLLIESILELSKDYFIENLNSNAGKKIRDYIAKRKISDKAYKYFELGYAENKSSNLIQFLTNKNIPVNVIIDSGLVRNNSNSNKPYDFFRNRLIFPIHDKSGNIIAFGGRGLEGVEPKYLNSPDTVLFKKRRTLYNFHRAKKYVQKYKMPFIVVEGYIDVIALYHVGLYGAVAPLGTALSEEQLIMMWRISDEPIICMDGDKAGYRAAMRTLNIAIPLLKPGKSLRFSFLPEGEDPDNLVSNNKKDLLIDITSKPLSMFDFFWKSETENISLDTPERRAGFKSFMDKRISLIVDQTVRKEYKNTFYSYFNKHILKKFNHINYSKNNLNFHNIELDKLNADRVNKNIYVNFREKNLLESILNNPGLFEKIDEEFSMLVFSNNDLNLLRLALIDLYKNDGKIDNKSINILKENKEYSFIFENFFRLKDWTKNKFTPDYVKKNEDLNYVEKSWREAADLQKIWYKKNKI